MSVEYVKTPTTALRGRRWKGQRVKLQKNENDTEATFAESVSAENAGQFAASHVIHFEAVTDVGPVGVKVEFPTSGDLLKVESGVLHGLIVGLIEERTQFIESWFQCPIDLYPVATMNSALMPVFAVLDSSTEEMSTPASISVHMPVWAWGGIPDLHESMDHSSIHIEWVGHEHQLILDQFKLMPNDCSSLRAGCIVLVPESFKDVWTAVINVRKTDFQLSGCFDPVNCSWTTHQEGTGDSDTEALTLECISDGVPAPGQHDRQSDGVNARIYYSFNLSARSHSALTKERSYSLCSSMNHMNVVLELSSGERWFGHFSPMAKGHALYLEGD